MKIKKFVLPIIILVIVLVANVVLACVEGIVMRPQITEEEFSFSITYEYDGTAKTIEDLYICTLPIYENSMSPEERFWQGTVANKGEDDISNSYLIFENADGKLLLETGLCPACLMGDEESCDCDEEEKEMKPSLVYQDADGSEYTDGEIPVSHGARIVSWEYPEPIENELYFSHISRLDGDTSLHMTLVTLLALVACIVFVKKDSEVTYTPNDKLSMILNIIVGCTAIPFMAIACALVGVNGGGDDILSQIIYCVPSFAVFALAASVCLRRKGYGKSAIVVQFAGPAVLVVLLAIDFVAMFVMSI